MLEQIIGKLREAEVILSQGRSVKEVSYRLGPTHCHHVCSYNFMGDRTHDGRPIKILMVIDDFSWESLAILVERRLNSYDVLHCLADLFVTHGPSEHIGSDKDPEFTAHAVRHWLQRTGVPTLFIKPGSQWEKGYCESFHS